MKNGNWEKKMSKVQDIREYVDNYFYRKVDGEVHVPLSEEEIQWLMLIIKEHWQKDVDMNRKGKTPSDIPLAPEKHSDMLWKLSHAEDSCNASNQYGIKPEDWIDP